MPSSLWKRQNGRTIEEIAMTVRTAASGASEMYEEFSDDFYILEDALKEWEPSVAKWTERVDNSIRNLIEACLFEAKRNNGIWIKNWLKPRGNGGTSSATEA